MVDRSLGKRNDAAKGEADAEEEDDEEEEVGGILLLG